MSDYDELAGAFSALKLASDLPSEEIFLASFSNLHVTRPPQNARRHQQPLNRASGQTGQNQHHRTELPAPAPASRRASIKMNMAQGHDSFRPFQNCLQHPPPSPLTNPNHVRKYSAENPSSYYMEQTSFYFPPTRPDPFERPDEVPEPKTHFQAVVSTNYIHLAKSLLFAFPATLFMILTIIGFSIHRAIGSPVRRVQNFVVERISLYEICAFFLAMYVAALLPSWKGAVVEIVENVEPEPLYRIFIAGRDAIGTGPVTSSRS